MYPVIDRQDPREDSRRVGKWGLFPGMARGMERRPAGMMDYPREGYLDETVTQTTMMNEMRMRPFTVPLDWVPPRGEVDVSVVMRPVEGRVELTPGVMFKGQMSLGVPEGQGESFDVAGREVIYRGEWKAGMYDGLGTLYSRGEQVARGMFEKGWLKEGSRKMGNGAWFVGQFNKANLPHGRGRYVFPTGVFVEGTWDNFKPVGKMEYHFPDDKVSAYDLGSSDDVTHLEISFTLDSIVYANTSMESYIFYANGDIYVGSLISRRHPQNGDFYRFNGTSFMKLQYGERSDNLPSELTLVSIPGSVWKMVHVVH